MGLLHHQVDMGHPNQGVIAFLKVVTEEVMGVQNHLKAMDLLLLLLDMGLLYHQVAMDHQNQWVMVHLNQVAMEVNMGLQNHLESMDLPPLLVIMETVMGLQSL